MSNDGRRDSPVLQTSNPPLRPSDTTPAKRHRWYIQSCSAVVICDVKFNIKTAVWTVIDMKACGLSRARLMAEVTVFYSCHLALRSTTLCRHSGVPDGSTRGPGIDVYTWGEARSTPSSSATTFSIQQHRFFFLVYSIWTIDTNNKVALNICVKNIWTLLFKCWKTDLESIFFKCWKTDLK